MDTDDMSHRAYECLLEACSIAEMLGTEMGAAARHCRTEDEFLKLMIDQIEEIEEDPIEYLESYGLEETADSRWLVRALVGLKRRITKVMNTPVAERTQAETPSSG